MASGDREQPARLGGHPGEERSGDPERWHVSSHHSCEGPKSAVHFAFAFVVTETAPCSPDLHELRAAGQGAGAGAWRSRSPSRVHDELACLRLRATNPGAWSSRQPCRASRPLTPGIRAERLRFGEHGVLELLRDASLDHLLGWDLDGFPGCWVATGPRFALLQDELRDAGQRELAAILKLLLAHPLQLFEELPRVGALEADVDGQRNARRNARTTRSCPFCGLRPSMVPLVVSTLKRLPRRPRAQ